MKPSKFTNFYVRSGMFGLLSIIGAVFNYALYPVLVRILNTSDFGDFAIIVAISNQLLGILLATNIISIYLVKTQPEDKARAYAQIIQKALIWFFLAGVVLLMLLSPYLHNLLKVQHFSSFLILGIILVIAVPGIIWSGYLQGHKELIRIGSYNVSAAIAKLIIASLLAMKLGSSGGILGVFFGAVVGLLVLWAYPGVKLPKLSSIIQKTPPEDKRFLLGMKAYFIECLVVVGGLSFLQNYDITLAKILFSPSTAGLYSGISILSNALYYLCFLLIWIILPEIQIHNPKVNRRILTTAYKMLGIISVGAVGGVIILRNFIAQLLLGKNFASQSTLLIFATLYQLTLVAITLYAFYLLVNRSRRSAVLIVTVFGCTTLVPALFRSTPLSMIRLLWLSLLLGFCLYQIAYRLLALRPRRT